MPPRHIQHTHYRTQAEDGFTYDREAILAYFAEHGTKSPKGVPIMGQTLRPNPQRQQAIERLQEKAYAAEAARISWDASGLQQGTSFEQRSIDLSAESRAVPPPARGPNADACEASRTLASTDTFLLLSL